MDDRRQGPDLTRLNFHVFRLPKGCSQSGTAKCRHHHFKRAQVLSHLRPFKSPSQVKSICFHRLGVDSATHSAPSRLSSLLEISSPLSVKPSNSESPSSGPDGRIRNALRHVIRLLVSYVPMSLPIWVIVPCGFRSDVFPTM